MRRTKNTESPCVICNPSGAEPGDYCDTHRDELHRLEHRSETLFRLQRTSRGKDHESYHLFFQAECEPCGRILVTETDPENLAVLVLVSGELNLDAAIEDYKPLGIAKTYGDALRQRIQSEIIHSWYGNARACVDVLRLTAEPPTHWDVDSRGDQEEAEDSDSPPPPDGNPSVH